MISLVFGGFAAALAAKKTGDFLGTLGGQAVAVPIVVEQVKGGSSTAWREGHREAGSMSDEHYDVARGIDEVLAGLQEAWTGKGADGARATLGPFTSVMRYAAETLGQNARNLEQVADGFDNAKVKMDPMPARPERSGWDTITPWDTDKEDEINSYNALARKNLEIYHQYSAQAQAAAHELKLDYGQPQPFTTSGDRTADPVRENPVKDTSGFAESRSAARPSHRADQSAAGIAAPPESEAGIRRPAQSAPIPGNTGPDDGTRAAGFLPSTLPGTGTSEVGFPGGQSASAGSGAGPGTPGPAGVARPPGRGAIGAGIRPGGSPAAGKTTGATPLVSTNRPGRVGAPATSGRGPGAPMAAMPPGGGPRNPGGEDSEHERKYGVPDSTIFEPDGDEEGPADPRTGQRAVPPTIGA